MRAATSELTIYGYKFALPIICINSGLIITLSSTIDNVYPLLGNDLSKE